MYKEAQAQAHQIELEELKVRSNELEEQEMMMDAQKSGVKMAADRRTSNAKIDLETMKTMQNGKGKGQ